MIKLFKKAGHGVLIGLSINSTFLFLASTGYDSLASEIVFRSYIVSIIIGIVSSLSTKLYDLKNLGMLKATIIHYILVFATVSLSGLWAGWLSGLTEVIPFFLTFSIIYLLIYLGSYFSEKRKVEDINKALKRNER